MTCDGGLRMVKPYRRRRRLPIPRAKMKWKGKMPEKVRSIKFTGSQSECEILINNSQPTPGQHPAGAKRARSGEHIKEGATKNVRRKGQADSSLKEVEFVEPLVTKQTVDTRCSPKIVLAACQALSPDHHQALSWLGLGKLADMTLDGLEQPELTSWLMDHTNTETMTIQVADNKKIAITPWKVSIVMGTPFGGEPLQYPDHNHMSDAFAELAKKLGVPASSNISATRLIRELKERKDDPSAVRFFIMILTKKDAWLGMNHSRVARIDWSKVVLDALRDSLVL